MTVAATPRAVGILISGGGSNMLALLDEMDRPDAPARAALVLSNDPEAGGLARAAARGVRVAAVDHRPFKGDRPAFEAALQAELEAVGVDLICLAGFMRILTPGFTAAWGGRMLNIHPSLLPKYPGLHTHARALAAGDAAHGCTVHEVTAQLDCGPLLGQARVAVAPGDTPETLAAKVLVQEHALYPAVLTRFASGDRTPIMLG
jgi:phosphoribosylglycinamide formyltransferase-1